MVVEEMKSMLDIKKLKKFGFAREWLVIEDTLLFWQLLFPVCDLVRSSTEDNKREAFFSLVKEYSNLHASSIRAIDS